MIIATDVETYEKQKDGTLKPTLNARNYTIGVTITETGKTYITYTPEEHWQLITQTLHQQAIKRRGKNYIYGHKHQYDYLSYAQNHLLEPKMNYITDDPLYYIYDQKTYLLDTLSYYKMTLEEIGQLYGTPKQIMPKTIYKPEDLIPYCTQDAKITLNAILQLKNNLAAIGYKPRKLTTAAQTAITTFLTYTKRNQQNHLFMQQGRIPLSPNYKQTRLAHRGGRVEAYQTGIFHHTTQIDQNSAYANAMTQIKFPNLRNYYYTNNTDNLNKNINKTMKILQKLTGTIQATIRINLPPNTLPYLPIRYKTNNTYKQHYPKEGTIKGTWTIPEINHATKIGYKILKIHWIEAYPTLSTNPFTQYVKDHYKLRLQKPELKPTIKILLNNLYGKFAQHRTNKTIKYITRDQLTEYESQGYKITSVIDNLYIITKETGEYTPPYYQPLLSALITAQHRHNIYQALNKIPEKDRLYCSTDGLLFKGNHLNKFKIGNGLGEYKIEHQNCTVNIKGEQKYVIDDQIKISGLPNRNRTDTTQINKKNIPITRMITRQQAIDQNNLTLAGTFTPYTLNLQNQAKINIKLPNYIDETKEYT